MKIRIAVLLMLGTMPWAELHAQARPVSTTFKVSARVEAGCEVMASDLIRSATRLRATCTPDATYDVGLNRGASRNALLGKTTGTETVIGIGTGLVIDHTLFGRVPAVQVVPAGNYADSIIVHVYY